MLAPPKAHWVIKAWWVLQKLLLLPPNTLQSCSCCTAVTQGTAIAALLQHRVKRNPEKAHGRSWKAAANKD